LNQETRFTIQIFLANFETRITVATGKPYLNGRFSTVDLHVLTSLD
jgi:hypothetical protein